MGKSASKEERMITKIINTAKKYEGLKFCNDDAQNDSQILLLATALTKSRNYIKILKLKCSNKLPIFDCQYGWQQNKISQNGWSSLYEALGFLTGLKGLHIDLNSTNQSVKSFKKLGQNLEKLGKLENLIIDLGDIQQRHGKGWEFLFQSFKKLFNLRNLTIYLSKSIDCNKNMKLSNRAILLFSQDIYTFQKLQKLTVNLRRHSYSEKIWSYFFKTISQCSCLTDLDLDLMYTNCQDFSISHLTMSSMKSLMTLYLNLRGSKMEKIYREPDFSQTLLNFHNSMIKSGFQGRQYNWISQYQKN